MRQSFGGLRRRRLIRQVVSSLIRQFDECAPPDRAREIASDQKEKYEQIHLNNRFGYLVGLRDFSAADPDEHFRECNEQYQRGGERQGH
jgi:hypothetical protein